MKSLQERILEKVEMIPFSGCWVWTACTGGEGYGKMRVNNKCVETHRVSYEAFVAPIPKGLHIDHLCRVTCCVNPNHLEPVTPAENNRRGIGPSSQNSKKTHCKSGHEFSEKNTHFSKGRRRCRACSVIASKKYSAKKRGGAL